MFRKDNLLLILKRTKNNLASLARYTGTASQQENLAVKMMEIQLARQELDNKPASSKLAKEDSQPDI
jgi:hypothetical protein